MVNPAMQLSLKIPDKKLQVWAATLLAGEFRREGGPGRGGLTKSSPCMGVKVVTKFPTH